MRFSYPQYREFFLTLAHLKHQSFDWQQSCVSNVAQEWAWNWHFLEPDFLNEHEESLAAGSLTRRFFFEKVHPCKIKGLEHNSGGLVQMIFLFKHQIFRFRSFSGFFVGSFRDVFDLRRGSSTKSWKPIKLRDI